jgi:Flp pilus assembly pilin Flp
MSDILLRASVRVQSALASLKNREAGQTMTEYVLILAGIALLVILAVWLLGGNIEQLFSDTASTVENPPNPGAGS